MSSPARDAETPIEPGQGHDRPAGDPAQHRRLVTISLVALLVLVIIGAAAGITTWLTHGFRNLGTIRYHQAAVFSVRLGTCINLTPNGTVVHVVPCAGAHDAEVFGTFQLAGRTWPGTTAVQQKAQSGCVARLTRYLNPQLAATNLAESYVYPGQQAWDTGERTVVCEVHATSGKLTGSVRSGV